MSNQCNKDLTLTDHRIFPNLAQNCSLSLNLHTGWVRNVATCLITRCHVITGNVSHLLLSMYLTTVLQIKGHNCEETIYQFINCN